MTYILTPNEMADFEKAAFRDGYEPYQAMERAARHVFNQAKKHRRVLIFAGGGNNGGDGLACALQLHSIGAEVTVIFLGEAEALSPHAYAFYKMAKPLIRDTVPDTDFDCIIDGIFGIGFHGKLDGRHLDAVNTINAFRDTAEIIAIDIPSGLNGKSGEADVAVKAHKTVTFQAEKLGLIINRGADLSGEIIVCDIGIPVKGTVTSSTKGEIFDKIPPIECTAHKGTMGHVGVIAGSFGMEGAAIMASHAALRSGAGKVSLAVSADIKNNFITRPPEVLVTVRDDIDGFITDKDSVLFGCGMGRSDDTRAILEHLIKSCTCPLVIDADGLYHLNKDMLIGKHCPIILTPHIAEAARLFGVHVSELIKDPVTHALEFAKSTNTVVLIKSNYNLITDGFNVKLNRFGCSGMATAGSGDVLAGITAFWAQRAETLFDAAEIASYLHGAAGRSAQARLSAYSMTATDIIAELHNAYKSNR